MMELDNSVAGLHPHDVHQLCAVDTHDDAAACHLRHLIAQRAAVLEEDVASLQPLVAAADSTERQMHLLDAPRSLVPWERALATPPRA